MLEIQTVADACYGRRVVQNCCRRFHVVILVDFVICVGIMFLCDRVELSRCFLSSVCVLCVSASYHSVSRRVSSFLTAVLVLGLFTSVGVDDRPIRCVREFIVSLSVAREFIIIQPFVVGQLS